ncbi:MAG: ATP synthase subunit I [Deltaproteobacteria bacterium]|nr:ATP synthase subunit I [Deltaproteobacteria bacterium]
MTEMMLLIVVGIMGGVLGVIFFGGLWWTVKKGVSSRQPALLFFASLLLRTIIVLTGFYLVTTGHWSRLLACLLGFIIARFIVIRLTDSQAGTPPITRRGGQSCT